MVIACIAIVCQIVPSGRHKIVAQFTAASGRQVVITQLYEGPTDLFRINFYVSSRSNPNQWHLRVLETETFPWANVEVSTESGLIVVRKDGIPVATFDERKETVAARMPDHEPYVIDPVTQPCPFPIER